MIRELLGILTDEIEQYGLDPEQAHRIVVKMLHNQQQVTREAIESTGGNIAAAAFKLGVSRATIYRRLNGQAKLSPLDARRRGGNSSA